MGECKTPGAHFRTTIKICHPPATYFRIEVDVPFVVNMTSDEAKRVEDQLHDAVEQVLAPYFTTK